jgi:murein DD-endopeptidase MepM/ murein hydrolase activator NlpD
MIRRVTAAGTMALLAAGIAVRAVTPAVPPPVSSVLSLPVAADPPNGPLGGELPTGVYKPNDPTFTPGGVVETLPLLRTNIDDPFPPEQSLQPERWLLPVPGYITSPFGKVRMLPVYRRKIVRVKRKGKMVNKVRRVRIGRRRHVHHGIDLKAHTGDGVKAVAGGVVSYAGKAQGYGWCVYIQHPDGLETRYAHASHLNVQTGDTITAGEVIAQAGCTGRCTGPHLHFEVRKDGQPLNPLPYLQDAKLHEEELGGEGEEGANGEESGEGSPGGGPNSD